jgi:hypothetical protein
MQFSLWSDEKTGKERAVNPPHLNVGYIDATADGTVR